MIIQTLHEGWLFREAGETEFQKATVPGSVISDLLAGGKLPDPYFRDNEKEALKAMEKDYLYHLTFSLLSEKKEDTELVLRFEGLDTIAEITLNGVLLAKTENMHRTYEFTVTELCQDKENDLDILFRSPTKAIKEAYCKDPVDGTEDAMKGFVHLRKAHYMFGWDWGPRIPDAGIFRNCELRYVKKARLSEVCFHQEHKRNGTKTRVSLLVNASVICNEEEQERLIATCRGELFLSLSVFDPEGCCLFREVKNPGQLVIENARLWWPNGAGEQPLYRVVVELLTQKGEKLDRREYRLGLRTITVDTKKDEFGSRFAHVVNGVALFAMGADYIPEDNILSRMNRERTYQLLFRCKEAHFNCIRVWGGGFYPGDDFFDICDELGLLVWQDFMFACGHYRFTKQFENNVSAELRDNIRRIRHHACVALFCGNNEMELFTKGRNWNGTDELAADYLRMYEDVFRKIMRREAPDAFYWPASPSSGGSFDEPNDENRGDVHYWEVWHGNKPFTEYRQFFFRYLSEFGFQSFPSEKTIEAFTEEKDRNIFSYIFEKHQRNAAANGKILIYLEQMYLYPTGLKMLVYASQLLQAEAIRYGVEHFRRNRGRCMGTVYWQLNDCWPVASWSSVDYYGRLKALHYYAKRFFAPLLLSCEEKGMLGRCQNVNAEEIDIEKGIRLCVTNDTRQDFSGTVVWQIRNADAEVLSEKKSEIFVTALSAKWLEPEALPDLDVYHQYVSYQLLSSPECPDGTVLFCPPKHFSFRNPNLSCHLDGDEIVVKASAYAKSVRIQNSTDDLVLSDNYFDMNAGEKRVRILEGIPDQLKLCSVFDIR